MKVDKQLPKDKLEKMRNGIDVLFKNFYLNNQNRDGLVNNGIYYRFEDFYFDQILSLFDTALNSSTIYVTKKILISDIYQEFIDFYNEFQININEGIGQKISELEDTILDIIEKIADAKKLDLSTPERKELFKSKFRSQQK